MKGKIPVVNQGPCHEDVGLRWYCTSEHSYFGHMKCRSNSQITKIYIKLNMAEKKLIST